MNIAPVDGSNYFGLKPQPARSEMNLQTFIQLLTVQLANQNPLEPMNDRDFFAQMAQLGTVQGMEGLRDSMDVTQASALIGKNVTALRPMTESDSGYNSIVTGTVKRMTIKNGEYYLGLQEPNGGIVEVRMSAVREVSQ